MKVVIQFTTDLDLERCFYKVKKNKKKTSPLKKTWKHTHQTRCTNKQSNTEIQAKNVFKKFSAHLWYFCAIKIYRRIKNFCQLRLLSKTFWHTCMMKIQNFTQINEWLGFHLISNSERQNKHEKCVFCRIIPILQVYLKKRWRSIFVSLHNWYLKPKTKIQEFRRLWLLFLETENISRCKF